MIYNDDFIDIMHEIIGILTTLLLDDIIDTFDDFIDAKADVLNISAVRSRKRCGGKSCASW